MQTSKIFQELGLKDEHKQIYLANLDWGETSITNISRKANIARTSIYHLIKDLIELGLIKQTLKQGKKFYTASPPDHLFTLLEKKQTDLNAAKEELDQNYHALIALQKDNKNQPRLEYLEGSEGIIQAYNRSLEGKEQYILCLTEDYKDIVSEKFFDEYFDKLFSSETKTKEIVTIDDFEYINKRTSEKNLHLMLNPKEKTETDTIIYDNTVIFVSFNKTNPYALIIEDKQIANAMKSFYDSTWEHAKKNDPRTKKGKDVLTEWN